MVEYTPEELTLKWSEFLEEYGYESKIIAFADSYPERRSLEVLFEELNRFDTDLAIYLLRHPQNSLLAGEQAIARIVPPSDEEVSIHLRIKGLPRDRRIQIRDLRSKHLGTFVSVEGLVRKATEVRPKVIDALFQCMRCSAVIKEEQEGNAFREPLECYEDQGGCKRSASATKFKLVGEDSRYVDTQKIEIQEAPEGLRGGEEPQRLTAYVEDDLTGLINPGARVVLNGVLRSAQRGRPGARSTLFDIFVDINSIELEQVEFEEIEITPEDVRRIKSEAQNPDIFTNIINSIAPSIYGLEAEKEALALQLFGGLPKLMPDGRRIRGDIHILLVGDPGTAKSELLSYMSRLSPRGIYATGKAASAAGLTAAAVRDEFGEGRWTLEAGALVLADKGLACLHPSSRVMVDGSSRSIEEIFDDGSSNVVSSRGQEIELSPLDLPTVSFNVRSARACPAMATLVARRRYKGPMLSVTLDSGLLIRLTPNHLVLDGESLSWKRFDELKPRARLVAIQRIPSRREPFHLPEIVPGSWSIQSAAEEKVEIASHIPHSVGDPSQAVHPHDLTRATVSGEPFTSGPLEDGFRSAIHNSKHGMPEPLRHSSEKQGVLPAPVNQLGQNLLPEDPSGRDYALDRIVEVMVEDYEGYVYDLRVPDVENFLCDGIVVHNCIDEIDKMNPQDRSAIHEALEQQRVSVAKAGITAVLQARCAVLAAANPKFGRFDEHKYISEQIDMPPTLLSRFDIIFSIFDRPQSERDKSMADHILKGHLVGEFLRRQEEGGEVPSDKLVMVEPYAPHFDPTFLRKYVAYAKRVYPIMTPDAMEVIKAKYLDIRRQGEGEGSSVPITPRQLEAIIRLSEASARARLSPLVDGEDAERAVRIVEYWMRKVAGEEGRFDIDIIATGVSQSQREQIIILRDIIQELSGEDGAADIDDITRLAQERGIPPSRVEAWLKRWSQEGEIYSPAKNKYKLVARL